MTVTSRVSFRSSPTPFNAGQLSALYRLADLMIPASADKRMPSASSLGLFDDLSDLPPATVSLFRAALDRLIGLAQQQHQARFEALNDSEAMVLVSEIKAADRRFFHEFQLQTAARYLRDDAVLPLIGLRPEPLWPKGNQVEPGDWSLLDVVRKRAPIYRNPPD